MRRRTYLGMLAAAVPVAGAVGLERGLFGEQSRQGAEMVWEPVTEGLPENPEFTGMATHGNTVYVSLVADEERGVYELAAPDSGWARTAAPPDKYGTGSVHVSDSGRLFMLRKHHGLSELVDTSGDGTWSCIDCGESDVTPGEDAWPDYVAAGDGRLVVGTGTTTPEMFQYDLGMETWTDLAFPFDDLDGKPHVDLAVDGKGRIWYKSNYSGIYTYDGGSWAQTSPDSGAVSTDDAGNVYLSYERTGGTQLAAIFRYQGEGNWEFVHEAKGYSYEGSSLDGGSRMFFVAGRFGAVAVEGDKLWRVPSYVADAGVGLGDTAVGSAHHAVTDDGTVYLTRSLDDSHGDGSFDGRLLRWAPDLENEPFYSTDLRIETGNHLGASFPVGVHILDGGDLLVAANTARRYPDAPTTNIGAAGEGDGKLLRLTGDGRSLRRVYRLDSPVQEVAVGPDGQLAVASETAVTGYDLAAETTTWRVESDADAKAVAYGSTGHHVLVLDAEVRLFSPDHDEVHSQEIDTSYLTDVAVNAAGESYYLTGFDNKHLPDGNPVQVAYLRAYSFDGEFRWDRFGFDGGNLSNNVADTRLYGVEHRDGELYVIGESAGTQTIFRYDGERYDGEPSVRTIDHYNDLWNSGSAHIAYHARFGAESGGLRASQLTMTRLSSGKSNTFRVNDLAVDDDGRMYVGGQAAARLAARPAQTVNGRPVGEYSGPEPSLLVTTPAFDQRRTWATFNDQAATGAVIGVDTRDGTTAVVAEIDEGAAFTEGPQLVADDGGARTYLAVFDQARNYQYDPPSG